MLIVCSVLCRVSLPCGVPFPAGGLSDINLVKTPPLKIHLANSFFFLGGGSSNSREQHVLGGRVDVQNTQSVHVSMEQISLAITTSLKRVLSRQNFTPTVFTICAPGRFV